MAARAGGRPGPDGPLARWVDRDHHLAEIVDELVAMPAFGVDTEFHREKTYFPQLALVQLSWGDRRALVDPLEVDLAPFARALEGPATVVMHAASQDLEVLHRACGVLPRDLFDTQLAAGFCGHSLPSLSSLVERYYDVHLPKGDRLTDWLRRPLNEDQRTYAAADVEYLLGLQEQLTAHLAERGRLEWALDECQALRARGQVVRDPDDAWLRIKEARSLRGETAAVARAVAAWRERRAAELDQPVRFVLSDLAVVGIAQRRPKAAADLARIRGVDERHAKGRVGEGILAAVAAGRNQEAPRPTGPAYELDRKYRPAVALVAAWVSQLARDLEIETSLVATRADIEALLAGDPDARLTRGWRADLVGERIRRLVEGEAALAFDGRGNLLLEDRVPQADPAS
ncbi:MAG: HRDC domain-containing protein [Actinobacteria bacterium]|nr:HRDC domain-containing protein [Actinomycetota bacterium]